ncbi:PfkB family carbohydrate kinase [Prauserella flavalba]|uniref:PfkB family carbohydrate kinase n=1 Tax=Prauserella flavalba TaxID=1477506 RepID=UPI0036EC941F
MKPLVVIGDALLDVDIEGRAERLCPEAPVPVVDVSGEWLRPGGAGLAAALLATRTAPEVVLVTALGDDDAGRRLAALLGQDVQVVRLPLDGATVRKTRVRAQGQSLVRVDTGGGRAAEAPLPQRAVRALRSAGAVLVSDYGRGVAAHPEVRAALAELNVPVVWDPHPRGPAPAPGATLVTPNDKEALGFTHCADPAEAATTLRREWSCEAAAVTVGARGALLSGPGGDDVVRVPVPAKAAVTGRSRPDTCGAGDRFASAAAAALLEGADVPAAVSSAVDAAARFVAAGGAAALSVDGVPSAGPAASAFDLAERVRRQGGRLVATGGCFDLLHPGHISLLRQARALGDALVVCVNSDDSVRRLKGPGRPIVSAGDRVRLLEELESVDAVVVFDEPSPAPLLGRLRPDVWVKGGDYAGAELPEASVVRAHGGEIVLVPTVEGYSTTRLVQEAMSR